MKWSAVATLLAAPLALAGVIEPAELVARGDVSVSKGSSYGSSGSSGSSYGSSKSGSSYGGSKDISSGSTTIIVETVILLWTCEGGGSSTKVYNTYSSSTGSPPGQTHTVVVGGADLVYTPNQIFAEVGDFVLFEFQTKNHSVRQSSFDQPCVPLEGGFDGGFHANVNNTVVPPPTAMLQVKVDTPTWFYCQQTGHCGKGMGFAINPTANKTTAQFIENAIRLNGTGSLSGIVGGSASASAAAPAATTQAAPPPSESSSSSSSDSSGSINWSSGSGSSQSGGECSCTCFCGVSSYPSELQGQGGWGGMGGYLPVSSSSSGSNSSGY